MHGKPWAGVEGTEQGPALRVASEGGPAGPEKREQKLSEPESVPDVGKSIFLLSFLQKL